MRPLSSVETNVRGLLFKFLIGRASVAMNIPLTVVLGSTFGVGLDLLPVHERLQ